MLQIIPDLLRRISQFVISWIPRGKNEDFCEYISLQRTSLLNHDECEANPVVGLDTLKDSLIKSSRRHDSKSRRLSEPRGLTL